MAETPTDGHTDAGLPPNDPRNADPFGEIERGLKFAHIMMMVNQARGNQVIADNIALAELLLEKGVIDSEEFEGARAKAREQVDQLQQPRVRLGDLGDKYAEGQTIEIDCANRIHLCQARCCTLNFFLTAQDMEEGVARWDYGNPYWIKQGADGYCVHCDPSNRACTIHAQRPHVCRNFDCRKDKRIWEDFEKRIPAKFEDLPAVRPVAMAQPALQRPYGATNSQPAAAEPDRPSEG